MSSRPTRRHMIESQRPHDLLRKLHLIVGIVAIIIFVMTGQYMHWVHSHLIGMPDGPRLFYRSTHIYLLWSGLLNTLLGCYLMRVKSGIRRQLQTASSMPLLLAPALLTYSFFYEAYNPDLARPILWWANVLSLLGVVIQACVMMFHRRRNAV